MAQFLGVLQTIGYLALAVLLLMLMITIHEFGHYITAKMLHFKVYEFSIGMGKQIFKRVKKNGEIFSIRLIPIGGYCSFGEDDPNIPDTDPDSFNNKAPWKRLIVLFAGAFFNFLSAIIFAVILLCLVGYGRVVYVGTTFNNRDYGTVEGASETITLTEILNNSYNDEIPANVYLEDGTVFTFTDEMRIESINGQKMNLMPTTGANTILQNTKEGSDVNMVVIMPDQKERVAVTIKSINERQWAAIGNAGYDLPPDEGVYHNFGGALLKSVPFSFEIAGMVLQILGQLVTGQLGMNAVGGTVATVSVMGSSIGQALALPGDMAFAQICFLITLISINLAVFNWLPIPSLDGARMVFVIIEWIRGKPINRNLEAKIHAIGIICLMGFVVFADVFWMINSLSMHLLL